MSFEEEQLQYAEELKSILPEFKFLDKLFSDPSQVENKIWDLIRKHQPSQVDTKLLSDFQVYQNYLNFKSYLENEYREKKSRKNELEYLLSQTPAERSRDNALKNVGKTLDFVSSITPQHVSGRVYRVENSNGCLIAWLVFAIITFLIVAISNAGK